MRRLIPVLVVMLCSAGCATAIQGEARGPGSSPRTSTTTSKPTSARSVGGPQAGDCLKVNSASEDSADIEQVACTDKAAVFKVAKRLDNDTENCPTPDYEKYTESGRGRDFALCLMLNAKEGDCFTNLDDPAKRARTDCGSAEIRVVKVVSKADDSVCAPDTVPLTYPEPPTTFCVAEP